ncbi:hypothetical protein ACVWZR_002704 [Bradyrhizobium sp. i1.3.1]
MRISGAERARKPPNSAEKKSSACADGVNARPSEATAKHAAAPPASLPIERLFI